MQTTPDQRNPWLPALEAELARRGTREQQEATRAEEIREWLLDTLEEMGRRMTAPTARLPAGLAEEIARATDWARVDELRIPVDMSPAEAIALAMTVDLEAGVRLLVEYPDSP